MGKIAEDVIDYVKNRMEANLKKKKTKIIRQSVFNNL